MKDLRNFLAVVLAIAVIFTGSQIYTAVDFSRQEKTSTAAVSSTSAAVTTSEAATAATAVTASSTEAASTAASTSAAPNPVYSQTTADKYYTAPDRNSGRGKVIYLTFDDGPYKYTDDLLSVLDRYGVKATFFVTDNYPKYNYCIAKESEAGHTVAVHSYSHSYSNIYSSTDAYWQDFDKMNDVIDAQSGHRTNIFRFPGGSSNTVSRKYCPGIMTELTKQANEKGLTYVDWNVSSGDAGGTADSEQVYRNIIDGVQKHQCSVVLCHDVKPYTVQAMDKTIKWCLDNGYTFATLSSNSYNVHHRVNN